MRCREAPPPAGRCRFRMLVRAGYPVATTTTALTAVGLLSTATLFVLPLLALPAMLFGLAVSSELLRGAILAAVLAVFLLGGGSVLLTSDRVIRGLGHACDWVLHRVRPKRCRRRPWPIGCSSRATSCGNRSARRGRSRSRRRSATSSSTSWPSRCASSRWGRTSNLILVLLAFVGGQRPGDDPDHAGRPRLRGGGPHRCPHARRGVRRARGARDVALPALLVLAPAPRGPRGVDLVRPASPAAPRPRPARVGAV